MRKKLEEKWYRVFVPKLPTPENQNLGNWNKTFEKYLEYIDRDTIFIAHSSGPAFVLNILESINTKISACYFTSGFLGLINRPDFDVLNETITGREFDWNKIRKNCENFYMCHGSDDPYVPLSNAQAMSEKLGVNIDIIENAWHLNQEAGYTQFEYLLEKIND